MCNIYNSLISVENILGNRMPSKCATASGLRTLAVSGIAFILRRYTGSFSRAQSFSKKSTYFAPVLPSGFSPNHSAENSARSLAFRSLSGQKKSLENPVFSGVWCGKQDLNMPPCCKTACKKPRKAGVCGCTKQLGTTTCNRRWGMRWGTNR